MPRRPSKKTRSNAGKARPVNRADAKINKWNKASEVPMDEEDLFHANRDKVLLDGGNLAQDDDGDDDEVFALKGLEEDDDDDDDMDDDIDEEDEVEKVSAKKSKGKSKKKQKGADSSEEEESEEEEETWGRSKAAWYSSNAAQLESDDEEGNELEEQEAKRLQSKMREEMTDADFGLEDIIDLVVGQETDELAEPTPVAVQPLPTDKKLLLRHLEKTSPETLALARDWDESIESLAKTREKLAKIESEDPDALSLGMLHIYYQALLTYTTTLAFYLHMRSSEKYTQRPELLKSHPILKRLLTLKQSLSTLEDLDFDASDDDDDDDDGDEGDMTWDEIMADGKMVWDSAEDHDVGMEDDELQLLLEEASVHKSKPMEAQAQQEPPKKRRKTSSTKPAPVFDLVEPEFAASKPSSSNVGNDITDTYGEATSLQHADVADKTARKKSLRFHTSRIESTSAKRQGARNRAIGGDDDIPYRERKKEKEARLAKENTNKLRGQGGADLDETEPAPKQVKRRRDDEDGDDEPEGADGYYELVKKKAKDKKQQKKVEYDAMQESARPNFDEDNTSGPRSLTRAILANKGLTPHRPKSVRNPRVKKRLKFEKAKKKLSSQKATFKGGLANTGRYDGEKSGISKVIKSTRLG
ncbi:hypothetical protein H0H81_009357 [Sphagnurus paluster]|uniref:Sas10 C-terminal domain-containing protein n=1 Tax=Sphagnurus paluster TaxID=117069 RepID=A0A9P7GQM5_9AGAR|nr:hypothetical protein H0H81_009357 [Sphagnurus paluster]